MNNKPPNCIKHADGHKEWRLNGKLHREDGPAVEGANGYKAWYLNGKEVDKRIVKYMMLKKELEKWRDLGTYEELADLKSRDDLLKFLNEDYDDLIKM